MATVPLNIVRNNLPFLAARSVVEIETKLRSGSWQLEVLRELSRCIQDRSSFTIGLGKFHYASASPSEEMGSGWNQDLNNVCDQLMKADQLDSGPLEQLRKDCIQITQLANGSVYSDFDEI